MNSKKSKVFTHKLIALFLSVLMALSCFTGALTAFAASSQTDKDYHDSNLAANFMAWAETTDEQTAEALLDYADLYLSDLMTSLLGSDRLYFSQNVVVATITIDGYLDSIDGLYDLVRQLDEILGSYGNLVGGDVKNIDLSPIADLTPATSGDYVVSGCGKSYRQSYSAKELIMALAKTLYINSNDFAGKNVIGQFFKGTLDLGSILTSALGDDVYGLLQGLFGMWDGYETNLIYNIVANLILTNTKWFTDEEMTAYYADLQGSSRTYAWNFDDVLFKALNQELLQKISVLVTYPNYVYKEVDAKDKDGNQLYDEAGNKLTEMKYVNDSSAYRKADGRIQDSKLVYSSEEQYANNILLFVYDKNGDGEIKNITDANGNITVLEELTLEKDDTLFDFAFRALELAWETVLRDTLGLVHVNFNGHETAEGSVGSNYDNQFFYWMTGEGNKGWNYTDWTSNYTTDNIQAWADAVYANYGCASADDFIEAVKLTYRYDRSVKAEPNGNWQDIDSTSLFNKLRYSPLADIGFGMQTGPINLYFEQTGITSISDFFNTAFTTYDNMVAGFNDALVAATEILFINSDNIGYGTTADYKPVTNLPVPNMDKTGNTTDAATVASTLVNNFMAMFEYAANAADANILNPYYTANNITTLAGNLSETNFEDAMIPLLVACLNTPALDNLVGMIHDEKWDSAKDAEGVAIVALEEYLSYVLPDKDYTVLWTYDADGYIAAKSGEKLFDNAVLPMVRDALGYIISSSVPCRKADGSEWNVYNTDPTDSTTIFEILNSVMCYYASTDNFSDGTTGKAVASLLGVVDENGKCLVSMSNDIWTNLDNIINNLLPVIGTLQYGTTAKAGQASTKELIYDDIIGGILDIGAVNEHTGKQGITTIIEEIFTIVTADPISNQGVDVMIYDNLVVPIVNNLFGARYSGQGYDKVIPYSSWYDKDAYDDTKSSSPFDSLVTTSTLAHYSAQSDVTDNNDTGVFGILICNIYEAFGGAGYSNEGTQGCWTGAMFAVEAVNNFIPSFVPQLSDHELNAATAEVATPSQSSLTSAAAFSPTTLNITNNSRGLNRFYRDASGTVQRTPRYFMNVTSVSVSSSNGDVSNITLGNATGVIAPEKTKKISISGTAPSTGVLYTFTIKYDIFKGEMNGTTLPSASTPVYEGLETIAYMYLTTDKDWANTVYTRSSTNVPSSAGSVVDSYSSILEVDEAYEATSNSNTDYTQNIVFRDSKIVGTWLNDFIIPMSNPSSIKNYGLRIKNISGSDTIFGHVGGSTYSIDGVYTYYTAGTQYYAVSNGTISDTLTSKSANDTTMAYVAIDKGTGDILNFDLFDYYNPNTKTWERGTKQTTTGVYGGYTAAEINALDESIRKADGFSTRTHVAYTIDEALAAGYLVGVQRTPSAFDESGNATDYYYDAVYLNFSDTTYATNILKGMYENSSKESVTMGTPTAGIYLAMPKTSIDSGKTVVCRWINYDGTTDLSADDYEMPLCLYSSYNSGAGAGTGTTHIYIADDTGSSTLTQAYSKSLNDISTYRAADFTDYDATTNTSATFESMKAALSSAVETISTPISTITAKKLGSTMIAEANTVQTTATYGDEAFKVVTDSENLPGSVAANVTKSGGLCYYNEECTMPVYKHESLTDADVTTSNGKSYDAAGAEVVKVDGVWHLANTPLYETEWDTTTYDAPYRTETATQATDSNGKLLYKEISFVYRDSNGNKVTSKDDWAYKFAETARVIKPNVASPKEENRGMYQLDIDNLAYWQEQLESKVNTAIADRIVNEVSEDRKNLNNVNFNVASYEKMVQVAKDAEGLIWYEDTGTVDAQNNKIYKAVTNKSSLQIDAGIAMYNEFKGYVIDRGYIGNKLEEEISCATTPGYDDAANASVAATIYTYQDFDYTQTIEQDVNGNDVVTAATVTSATAADAEYGAWVDGSLVNQGQPVYTDASWNAYLIALSDAIKVADAQSAQVSAIYTAKTALQRAENNLTEADSEPVSSNITVSGTIVIATSVDGSTGDSGIGGINILDTNGNVLGTSNADGTFSVEVPKGTTQLIIQGDSTIDRTVTLTGNDGILSAVIPVCVCDYVKNGKIDSYDKTVFFTSFNGEYNLYCDLIPNNEINSYDKTIFYQFFGADYTEAGSDAYAELSLD